MCEKCDTFVSKDPAWVTQAQNTQEHRVLEHRGEHIYMMAGGSLPRDLADLLPMYEKPEIYPERYGSTVA